MASWSAARGQSRARPRERALQLFEAVSKWASKSAKLSCCVVRHAERADASWDSQWCSSKDALEFPVDPPLTALGGEQAHGVGLELQRRAPSGGWGVVVCSPYLRCVQTAIAICRATNCPLMLDHQWGEVVTESHALITKTKRLYRSHAALAQLVQDSGVELRNLGRIAGRVVNKAESIPQARMRYAACLLKYVDRARLSRTSVIIVTHGEALLPALALSVDKCPQINRVDYCSYVQCDLRADPSRQPPDGWFDHGTPTPDGPCPSPSPLSPTTVLRFGSACEHLQLVKHTLQVDASKTSKGCWIDSMPVVPMRDPIDMLDHLGLLLQSESPASPLSPCSGSSPSWAVKTPRPSEPKEVVVLPDEPAAPSGASAGVKTTIPTQDIVLPPPSGAPIGATTMLFGDASFGGISMQAGSAASSFCTEQSLHNMIHAMEAQKSSAEGEARKAPLAVPPAGENSLRPPPVLAAKPASTLLQRRKSMGSALPRLNIEIEPKRPSGAIQLVNSAPIQDGVATRQPSLSPNAQMRLVRRASVA